MLSRRAEQALFNIRDNAMLAQEFVAGLPLEAIKADRRTFYATVRCLEIVSEASRKLPASMRERHPALPWRAIMGLDNVYRHGPLANALEEFVWRTVRHSLGPLLAAVDTEIARLPHRSRAAAHGSNALQAAGLRPAATKPPWWTS